MARSPFKSKASAEGKFYRLLVELAASATIPIFYVPEQGLTFAEMTPEMKRRYSHRGKAFAALLPQLSQFA
jgi:inosine/xanthosine triphosphate pyrophosphatase family protein